jgi:antitoxin VapB
MNGRSQAVRIPKAFRFSGSEDEIVRAGDRVVLIPVRDTWSAALLDLLNRSEEPLERPSRARPRRSVVLD